jgi:hypothetical protein
LSKQAQEARHDGDVKLEPLGDHVELIAAPQIVSERHIRRQRTDANVELVRVEVIGQLDDLALSAPVLEVAHDEHQTNRARVDIDRGDRALIRRGALQEDSLTFPVSKDASGANPHHGFGQAVKILPQNDLLDHQKSSFTGRAGKSACGPSFVAHHRGPDRAPPPSSLAATPWTASSMGASLRTVTRSPDRYLTVTIASFDGSLVPAAFTALTLK